MQGKTVERALALSEDIAQVGMSVSKLAREARLLALNAKIESTRLGSKGSAFGIISEEMNQMSGDIAKTNQMVSDAAAAMSACLPVITDQATEQIHDLKKFIAVMDELKGAIEKSLSSSNEAGETHIDKILGLAYSALSHLQFQDPMIQNLQKIDHVMKDLQENLNKDLEVPSKTVPSIYDERLGEKANNNDETPPSQIGRDPGDVLLF